MKAQVKKWAADFRVVLPAALVIAFALRIAWPLADPPPAMSWSTGAYTDPASNALAARYEVERYEGPAIEVPERFIYPALHALARMAYQTLGVRRLSTVLLAALLGTATVAALALAVRRGPGEKAAIFVAVLAATSSWLAPNSRVLTAEGVALLLLAMACFVSLSRRALDWPIAGAIAAAAGFLGKYHALAFLPALLIFLRVRLGWRAAWCAAAGALVVGATWAFAIFLPHRTEIAQWLRNSSVGAAEAARVGILPQHGMLAPFKALKDSWLSFRMPIVAIAGTWFVLDTVAARDLFRRRIDDGSALFVLWAIFMALSISLFSYAAPRYFMLVAAPLVVCVACQIAGLAERSFAASSRRIAALFLFFWIASFIALHWLVRVESLVRTQLYLEDWVLDPTSIPKLFLLPEKISNLDRHVTVAFILAALITSFVFLRRRSPKRQRISLPQGKTAARILFAMIIGFDLALWGMWAAGRTQTIELAKASIREILPPNAVIMGAFAPLLTEGSSLLAVPHFGSYQESDLAREPKPTHVLLFGADAADLQREQPVLSNRTAPVARWPIRTAWARDLVLFRLLSPEDSTSYQLTVYEQAIEKLLRGSYQEAGALAEEYRRQHGETLTQIQLAASSRFADEGSEDAQALYRRAVEINPADPIPLRNLGWLAMRRGDEGEARRLWLKALKIDATDAELANLLRPLFQKEKQAKEATSQ